MAQILIGINSKNPESNILLKIREAEQLATSSHLCKTLRVNGLSVSANPQPECLKFPATPALYSCL